MRNTTSSPLPVYQGGGDAVFILLQTVVDSGVARGLSRGTRPGAQALEGYQRTFQPFKNVFLSRNLDQNVPKNAYFLEKSC